MPITAADIIVSARYDLRDEASTQYSDAMLLDFLNRGQRALCVVLSQLRSDWVNASASLTLLISSNTVALPTLFISDIDVKIGTESLTKDSVSGIRAARVINTTAGKPTRYGIQGTNMLFDVTTDAEYTVTLEYNTGATALVAGTTMPFNDEFDDILRQFIILCGKSRNEYIIVSDAAMQDYFYEACFSKLVARNSIPNVSRMDF